MTPPNDVLPRREVWALDGQGQRQLGYGPDIDLESLALNGSTQTWVKNGVVRSATL